ncbi:Nuclear elongation and deformation protein-like protein [Emericellopsis cladophorae]|uniref:Nuclear elongation and deformation protein-like protein n=1 Tax=Emericellopsis cladophorae TaxID=2686198 RepID=A0A9P9Y4E4_9HYPO|nr:Nuclear elongation and deformation protein-like protein [Emericellopsis cladophorae]KAI6783266.1 Nuclear elongation and deformation protein-like protein [Emericellopsis cladophorae]
MQYVRNLSDSVSTAWNSINPATLSGAIDVIVVQQQDGSLACSPFHVRFGKFSLLRPYEKKVEFKVNGVKQPYSMKLGEGGEAFFVFETTENIPQSMQTSPLVSPASSPPLDPQSATPDLKEPDHFELNAAPNGRPSRPPPAVLHTHTSADEAMYTPASTSAGRPASGDWSGALMRPHSDDMLRYSARSAEKKDEDPITDDDHAGPLSERSQSPPPLELNEAIERAMTLSKRLSTVGIPSKVNDTGDLTLDLTGFKGSEEEMIRAEVLARKILAEELEGNYDIGALFGFDAEGNLVIYSSEEARQAAMKRTMESTMQGHGLNSDAASDPGYQSDDSEVTNPPSANKHRRAESDAGPCDMQTPPRTPTGTKRGGDSTRNYAKTLRLTSEQLKDLKLKPGPNSMSFTVNRATCSANMYLWRHEVPVVISDIDGTITKSDALGHVLNMIGRDWTHAGIAKLYSDIAANGYNIMYLTSRSVGQADTTRTYLANIVQDGSRLPAGPTILSPDRTMAALRREVYLRQPQVFKMATLRDISNLYNSERSPFYAGFGNRLTDQISYRTVDVPRNRIFTINSNSEVSLDLLTLNKLKMSYVNINEVVDHYFPPISTLVTGGGEEFTDFMYWRDDPLPLDDFSASESDEEDEEEASVYAEDDEDEEAGEYLGDSYISRESFDDARDQPRMSIESRLDEEYEEAHEYDEHLAYTNNDYDDDKHLAYASEDDTQVMESSAPQRKKLGAEDVNAEIITGGANGTPAADAQYVLEPVKIRSE